MKQRETGQRVYAATVGSDSSGEAEALWAVLGYLTHRRLFLAPHVCPWAHAA